MTRTLNLIGLIALVVVVAVIPVYAWLEPVQQQALVEEIRTESVISAADNYAHNCVVCHGATGEGIAGSPPLNLEALQNMPPEDLARVIADGRYNTAMAAWSIENGGIFTLAQIDDLVTLIQHANWEYVSGRVAELGLTPPEVIEFEVTDEMLAALVSLNDSQTLARGLTIYGESCAACHNVNGSGTVIAPALDTPDIRATSLDDLRETVEQGVPGTLMAGWSGSLQPEEVEAVLQVILRWPEILAAGVEFPEVELASIPSSPERIAEGQALFKVACQSCHGVEAYGSPMAPALNNALFLSETPDAAIYQIIAGGVPGTLMPAWGSRFTDYDLQVLVAYLRSFEVSAPPIVPPIQ